VLLVALHFQIHTQSESYLDKFIVSELLRFL
jgi:hypothetical protein